tara:strand:+ start:97 stop:675 length:579 start_codon:yes stop_codon:yes gene_type:complete
MKKYFFLSIIIFLLSCSSNKGVYWCGDHPCVNKKEKEAYFKKTMIVEVRDFNKKDIKKDSEIEKLLKQAKINEKERILTEKDIKKKAKIEEKELAKRKKLEEKRRIKEEKELSKRMKLEEKKRIKEEKKLTKKNKDKVIKLNKKESKTLETTIVKRSVEKAEISSNNFEKLVEKIKERNSLRSFPDINDIPQ